MALSLISSNAFFNTTRDALATATASFAVLVNDILLWKIMTEDSASVPSTPSNTNTALTWNQIASSGAVASREYCKIYAATALASESIVVSGTSSNGTNYRGGVCNVWRGAQLAATPATNSTKTGATAPSATVTTTAANSAVDSICGDWDVASGARTYRSSATEETVRNNGGIQYECFHQTAGAAGSQTIGLTAPATQKWSMVGVEVQVATAVNIGLMNPLQHHMEQEGNGLWAPSKKIWALDASKRRQILLASDGRVRELLAA